MGRRRHGWVLGLLLLGGGAWLALRDGLRHLPAAAHPLPLSDSVPFTPPLQAVPVAADGAVDWPGRDGAIRLDHAGLRLSTAGRDLGIRLRDVRLGERSILPALPPPAPRAHGGNPPEVHYDRGHVTETYRLSADAVEQSFVLDAALEGRRGDGDLTVELGFSTSLEPRLLDGAVEFREPGGRPLLWIGRATAIDAQGRTAPLSYELADAGLVMRLDAGFVAEARFPLTIDPLMGFNQSFTGSRNALPGIAFNAASNLQVLAVAVSASSINVTSVNPLASTSTATLIRDYYSQIGPPRIAASTTSQSLLVWAERSATTDWSVFGQFVTTATGVTPAFSGPAFTISTGSQDQSPDVGWSASAGAYVVAWERQTSPTNRDLLAARVSPAGVVGAPFTIDASGTWEEAPSVMPSSSGLLGVAWIRRATSGAPGDVYACSVNASTSTATSPLSVSAVPSDEETPRLGADFLGTSTTYLAWTRRTAGGDGDVWGQRITFGAGGPALGAAFAVEATGANSFQPAVDAATRSGTSRAVFTWVRNPTVPPTQLGSDLHGAVYDASVDPPTPLEALPIDTSTEGSSLPNLRMNPSLLSAQAVWLQESSGGSYYLYGRRLATSAVPAIGTSATSFAFTAAAGNNNAYGNIQVANVSGGTLNTTITDGAAWLSASPTSAALSPGSGSSISLTANANGLAAGEYSTTLTITDPAALNSPVSIPVAFTVASVAWNGPAPSGAVAAGQLIPVSWTLSCGTATATHIDVHADNYSFPSATAVPVRSGGSGVYSGVVQAPATAGTFYLRAHAVVNGQDINSPVASVTVAAPAAPIIALNKLDLSFVAGAAGPNPASQELTLSNPGVGTLSWTASSGAAWLQVAAASGSLGAGLSQPFTVWVDVAGLAAGTYTGAVTFTAAGAANSGKTLPVTLTVVGHAWGIPPPASAVSGDPLPLSWSVAAGGFNSFYTTVYYGTGLPLGGGLSSQFVSTGSGTFSATFTVPDVTRTTTYFLAPHSYFTTVSPSGNATGPVATLIVHPRPVLTLSKDVLSFAGAAATAQSLTLTNAGGGTLAWTAAADAPWIGITPSTGSRPAGTQQSISVSVNAGGLPAGAHAGTITFSDAGSGAALKTVRVELLLASLAWVTPPAAAYVSGQTIPLSWTLSSGTAQAEHQQVHFDTVNPPWSGLSSPNQPGSSGTYSASLNAPLVAAPTTYYFGVHADILGAPVATSIVAVLVTPPSSPVIALGSRSLTFRTFQGGPNPAAQAVAVTAAGVGTLNWSAADGSPWLSETPASGSLSQGTSQDLSLAVDVAGLVAGTYTGTVALTAAGATNTPQAIAVTFIVDPAPTAAANPVSLSFVAAQGQGNPAPTYVAVSNSSGSILAWTATDDAPWISLDPPAYPGASLGVRVDPTGLAAGSYTGTLTITVPGAANSPLLVPVSLTVVSVAWTSPPATGYLSRQTINLGWTLSAGSATADDNFVEFRPATTTYGSGTPDQPGGSGAYAAVVEAPLVTVPTTYLFRIVSRFGGTYVMSPNLSVLIQPGSPGPLIQPGSASLSVSGEEGGPAPSGSYLSFSNPGSAPLNWTAAGSPAWLSATPASGTLAAGNSQALTVNVNTTGLSAGTYSGSLTISDPAASNSPRSIPVTLRIVKTSWVTPPAGPYTSGALIPLAWSVDAQGSSVYGSEVHWGTSNPPWYSTGSGGQSGAGGAYSATLRAPVVQVPTTYYFGAHANVWNSTPGTPVIAVTINPSAAPVIHANAASLAFASTSGGANPSSQTLTLSNAGSVPLALQVSDDAAWLSLSPGSLTLPAGASQLYTASVDISGLAPGLHTATVTLADPTASNSPITIPVTLTVMGVSWTLPPPASVMSGASMSLSWNLQAGALAASQNRPQVGDSSSYFSDTGSNQPGASGAYTTTIQAPLVSTTKTYLYRIYAYTSAGYAYSTALPVVVHPPASKLTIYNPVYPRLMLQGGPGPNPQTFTIQNGLQGTLTWSASDDVPWLSLSPASGSIPPGKYVDVTATYVAGALPPGLQSATIRISSPEASNSPHLMPVSLTVVSLAWAGPPGAAYTGGATIPFSWSFNAGGVAAASNYVFFSPSGGASANQPGPSGTYTGSIEAPVVAAPTVLTARPYVYFTNLGTLEGPPATVTVSPPTSPVIGLSPASLSFTGIQGGPPPAPQDVMVTNLGVGTLAWSAADGTAWLAQAPGSGNLAAGASQPISVSVDLSGLSAGRYAATLLMTDPASANAARAVLVTLEVLPPTPVIGLSPANLVFQGHQSGANPPAQAITLSNGGGGTLAWTSSSSASWLGVSPTSGSRPAGTSQSLSVSTNLAGLTPGVYSGTLSISAPGASNSPSPLTVTLTVHPPVPAIGTSSSSLTFAGAAAPPQILTLTNSGVGTLTWDASDDATWMSVSPTSGSLAAGASQPLTVTVDATGLSANYHSAKITFTAPGALQTPVDVPVAFNLYVATAQIGFLDTPLSFSAPPGGPNPPAWPLRIINSGATPLNWSAVASAPWIGLSPATGSTDPYLNWWQSPAVDVTVNVAGLAAGAHSGTITISDPAAPNSPKVVDVRLVVGSVTWTAPPAAAYVSGQTIPVGWTVAVGGAAATSIEASLLDGYSTVESTPEQPGTGGAYTGSLTAPVVTAATTYGVRAQAVVNGVFLWSPTVTITVTPPAGPVIHVDPSILEVFTSALEPAPTVKSLLLTNTGVSTLNWTASDNAAWISISPASGSLAPGGQAYVSVLVNPAGLAGGAYSGTITISDPAASNSPRSLPVRLQVVTIPWITPPPASATAGQTLNLSWNVQAGSEAYIDNSYVIWSTSYPPTSGSYAYQTPPSTTSGPRSASTTAPVVAAPTVYYFQPVAVLNYAAFRGPITAVTVAPAAAPRIGLDPTSLSFIREAGAAGTYSQSVKITNTGSGALNWTSSDPDPWVSQVSSSGSLTTGNYTYFSVIVDSSTLVPGTYSSSVAVAAAGASNTPQAITVNLTAVGMSWVTPPPASMTAGQSATLSWTLDAPGLTATSNSLVSGLSNPPSGSSTGNQPGPSGTYSSPWTAPAVVVPTTYYVRAAAYLNGVSTAGPVAAVLVNPGSPSIQFNQAKLDFFAVLGGGSPPAELNVAVRNSGSGTLNWTAGSSAAWLSVSPLSGSLTSGGSHYFTISPSTLGLAAGPYAADITVTDPAAANSPQKFRVNLVVAAVTWSVPPPTSAVAGSPVSFGWIVAGGAVSQTYARWEPQTGGGGGYTTSMSGPAGLYSGSFTAPDVASPTVYRVTPFAYAPGYVAGTPALITINPGPRLSRNPASMSFSGVQGAANPAAQLLNIANTGAATLNWAAVDTAPWLTLGAVSGSLGAGLSQNVAVNVNLAGLAPGSYPAVITLAGQALDAPQTVAVTLSVAADFTPPAIAGVTSSAPNATYGLGAAINVTVNFSEPVTLAGGNLLVTLDTGAVVAIAPFGPSTSALGTYIVAAGQNSPDLNAAGPLALAGGATLRDVGGNDCPLVIPPGQNLADAKAIVVDTLGPSILSVNSSSPNATYVAGQAINVTVNFSEPATLTGGALRVTLDTGAIVSIAPFANATSALGSYVVAAGQSSPDLMATSPLTLQGGAVLEDLVGNDAALAIPLGQNIADAKAIVVDAVVPAVANVTSAAPDGAYRAGQAIGITVNFSEAVTLAGGNLQITTSTGTLLSVAPFANATSASGVYTITAGQTSPDLGATIALQGGATLLDAAGNPASLTVPPGQGLADLKNLAVDTTAPGVAIASPTAGATWPTNALNLSLGGTASDLVGIAGVAWSNAEAGTSGTFAGTTSWTGAVSLVGGTNTITVTATDLAGNTTTDVLTATSTPDLTAPAGTISAPASSSSSPAAISGTATDANGIVRVTWANGRTGDGGTATGTTAWSASIPLAPGANLITVVIWDAAGNSTILTATIDHAPADATPPAIAILTPSAGGSFAALSTPIAVAGTASDAGGLATVEWVNLATGVSGTAAAPAAWSVSVPLLAGENRIRVTARDLAGNEAFAEILITFSPAAEALPPTIQITAPTAAGTHAAAATPLAIGGTATDGTGVARVTWANAATGGAGIANGTTAWTAELALLPGDNLITVTAVDPAGNTAIDTLLATYLPAAGDGTPPLLLVQAPAGASGTSEATGFLAGIASDDVGVATVVWANAATGETGSAAGTMAWEAPVPLAMGANAVTITAYDASGNAASDVRVITRSAPAGGGGGGGGGGGCGLTGLEALVLALLLRIALRRR